MSGLVPLVVVTCMGLCIVMVQQARIVRLRRAVRRVGIDPVTGLPTRAGAERHMRRLFDRGKISSMFIVDVDCLKQVNDRRGHTTGDAVLAAVAQEICWLVPPSVHIVRWGGDEFAGFVTASEEQHIRASMGGRLLVVVPLVDSVLTVTASVGISPPGEYRSWRALLAEADRVMYAGKAAHAAKPTPPVWRSPQRPSALGQARVAPGARLVPDTRPKV